MEKEENVIPKQQYSPIAVANTFIARYGKDCTDLSHMKLQKLVYMVHGWWLAMKTTSLPIIEEKPQVWKHGPVFHSLYHELKDYSSKQHSEPLGLFIKHGENKALDETIALVWGLHGKDIAENLSALTHREGTAWRTIAKEHNYKVPRYMSIENNYVKSEFDNYLKEQKELQSLIKI